MNRSLAILAWALLAAASYAGDAASQPKTILVFGDSLTEGGALPKTEREQVWIKQAEQLSGGKLRLINEGKGGRPTASLPELDAVLKKYPAADGFVVFLGANDSRDVSGKCVPNAVANVTKMIAAARKQYGDKLPILLVGPANIRKDALGPSKPIADQREANLKELGAAFEKLAKEQNCSFVSAFGAVPPESLTKDGVHPDGKGNEPLAKTILPALLKIMGAPK